MRSSASSDLLFIPPSVLFISDIAFFILDWSFFMVFYVFVHAVQYPYNQYSKLSDKLLASISSSSSGEFSCSFIWGLFLCLPVLPASLYLFLCIREICKDSGGGLCQMLLVTGPGQPVWSYQ